MVNAFNPDHHFDWGADYFCGEFCHRFIHLYAILIMKKYSKRVKVVAVLLISSLFILVAFLIGEISCRYDDRYGRAGFQFDKNLIWRLNKNFMGQKAYAQGKVPGKEPFVLDMNNRGFRGKNFRHQKEDGTKRILVLGDSYTAGLDYPDEEIFTGVFERMLNEGGDIKYEVMNVSCPAWGTDQQYQYWFTEGIKYRPDYVIIMTAPNDLRELYNKKLVTLQPDGEVEVHRATLPWKEKWGWYLATKSSFYQYLQKKVLKTNYGDFFKVFHYYPVNYGKKDSTDWDAPNYLKEPFDEIEQTYVLFEKLLENLTESCDKMGAKVMLAKIPAKVEFDGSYQSEEFDIQIINRRLKEVTNRQNIPFLDLNESLNGSEDPLRIFMSWEYHFNKVGHDFTAEQLYTFFNQNK